MRCVFALIVGLLALCPPSAAEGVIVPPPAPPPAAERALVPPLDGEPRELVPGVYTLGELHPMFAYLIEADDGLVLIDTGFRGQLDRLAEAILALGHDPLEIRHVAITHLHLDHWMNLEVIRRRTGARSYMGAADARVVEAGAPPELTFPARQTPADLTMPPTPIDHHIEAEELLPIPGIRLWAIPTPGHTPGSVCYLLEKGPWRILFGGDTLMSVNAHLGTYMTRLHPRFGGDVDAYRRTLDRLAELPVNMVLPGHPYFDRQRSGLPPHPVISPRGWADRLAQGGRELDLIEARFRADGRDFLDGVPRELAPGLLYLGNGEESAAYALEGAESMALVDPFALEAGVLEERLAGLGTDLGRASAALLTRRPAAAPERLATLGRGLLLYGDEGTAESLAAAGLELHQRVEGRRRLSVAGLTIEAIEVPRWSTGGVNYLVDLGDELAAFTGDTISPLTADHVPVQPPAGRTPGDFGRAARALALLESKPISLWLPGMPFAAQNANLYEREWQEVVRRNRRILTRVDRISSR